MIRVAYSPALLGFDLVHDGNGFVEDEGLESDVIYSLFTDARATPAELRLAGKPEDDQRGFWGDTWPDAEGARMGSKLWLLDGAKLVESTFADARRYAEEALAWMVSDGVVAETGVSAGRHMHPQTGLGVLGIAVAPRRHEDAAPLFQAVYDATTGFQL